MKTLNKFILVFVATLFIIVGCTKDFEETNVNPNQPTFVQPGNLLAYAQKNLMDNMRDEWMGGRTYYVVSQQWSQRNYTEEDRYQFREGTTNGGWRAYYITMKNLQQIIDWNKDPDYKDRVLASGLNENQIGAATILKCYIMQIVTDTWGDVPFTQALQGNTYTKPAFDSQQSIYTSILDELTTAVNNIVTTGPGANELLGDAIYGGNMTQWKKLGHSLRLKIALRMSKRDSYAAANQVLASINPANDLITDVADNAAIPYPGDGISNNPIFDAFVTEARNDFTLSKTFVDLLKGVNDTLNGKTNPFHGIVDPRLGVFAPGYSDLTTILGMPYGVENTFANAYRSNCPDYWNNPSVVHAADYALPIMTAAEVNFMLSELNNWNQAYYIAGVTASLAQWGITGTAATNYINALPAANQENVLTQKYIALYSQPEEAWFEYRRTGYPHTLIHPGEITFNDNGTDIIFESLEGDDIPRRLLYAIDEINLNSDNYKAAVTAMGSDDIDTRVWWDAP